MKMRAYAESSLFFFSYSYICNKSINQNTARSSKNPLTRTDGEKESFCSPGIDKNWV